MDTRFRYWQSKPFYVVDSLDDLHGPSSGEVHLPLRVIWCPGPRIFDLSRQGGVTVVYQAVIAEGTREEQCQFLNKDLLLEIWDDLNLDRRVRDAWEDKFPQLNDRSKNE